MELTPRQQEIKSDFIRLGGTWRDAWQGVLELDPEFLQSHLDLSMVPWRKDLLDPKVQELIYITIAANATHLCLPGVRQHSKAALNLGVTAQEIMEVLQL